MHNAFEDRSGKGRSHDPPGRPPEPSCPNCGHPDPARYCPSCGQSQRDPHRSVAHLAYAYRIADLQVELGKPDEALEQIEGFLAEHPDHPLPLGLASLAAARAGDSALARERARRFLSRAEADPPPGDSWFYPRFVAFRDHARRLLDSRSPEARSP